MHAQAFVGSDEIDQLYAVDAFFRITAPVWGHLSWQLERLIAQDRANCQLPWTAWFVNSLELEPPSWALDAAIPDPQGGTILHRAGRCLLDPFSEDLMIYLLRRGADPDSRDHQGRTPLHVLTQQDQKTVKYWGASIDRCVKALIAAGARVDALDNAGRQPIFFAIENGAWDAVSTLIGAGANASFGPPANEWPSGWEIVRTCSVKYPNKDLFNRNLHAARLQAVLPRPGASVFRRL